MAAFLVGASGQEVGAIVGVNPVPPPMTTAETLNAPVLLLHGTADQVVNVQSTRDYEQALRAAGRLVEAFYYEGLGHALVYDRRTQQDVLRRGSSFLRQYLSA
jgi:dipeptidyl aminopeptidase/acylaminoacyl peptidase